MLNKTKQIILGYKVNNEEELFMLPENSSIPYRYRLDKNRAKYDFPKFSCEDKKIDHKSLLYAQTNHSIRDYRIFESYNYSKLYSLGNQLISRLRLVKEVYARKLVFYGSQIDRNRGGNLSASLGFISFVPRRYRAIKYRALQSFMSLKIIFRRYRKFTYLYNLKVNLVSTFRPKLKQK